MKKNLRFVLIFSSVICFTKNIFAQNGACIPPVGLDCVTAPKYIDSVFTTNAATNFSNLGTNCNAQDQNYIYYQNKIAREAAGGSFDVHIGLNAVNVAYIGVWIDWNNDLIFQPGEQVYLSSGQNTSATVTVNVPLTAATDSLIFRIRSGTTLSGPCDSTDAGETEDYRLIVYDATGIVQPLENNSWIISPNPAGNFISVNFPENSSSKKIEVSICLAIGCIITQLLRKKRTLIFLHFRTACIL